MIQCGTYKDAVLQAINIISEWDNTIVKINFIKKENCWWIDYEIDPEIYTEILKDKNKR